jgi:hypothetical protein
MLAVKTIRRLCLPNMVPEHYTFIANIKDVNLIFYMDLRPKHVNKIIKL